MTSILRTIAAAALALFVGVAGNHAAVAAPVFYHFEFIPISGGGAGGEGTLTIDETLWTGTGSQTFDPISGLLSFDANVGGVAFAITDDVAFPLFPSVTLTDGIISAISYVGATLAGDVLNVAGRGFEFISAAGVTTAGDVKVPEPAAIVTFVLGAVALGAMARRRVRG